MELDGLKNVWQNHSAKLAVKENVQPSALGEMLHRKANDLISRLIRSVLFEYYFTIATLIVSAIIFPLTSHLMVKITTGILIIITVPFIFIYRSQLKKLHGIFSSGENVKDALEKLLRKFNRYLCFYRISYRALTLAALIIGLILGGELSYGDNWMKVFRSPFLAIMLLMILVAFVYLMDKFIGWYIRRLYGNYLTHLETVIRDLEEP